MRILVSLLLTLTCAQSFALEPGSVQLAEKVFCRTPLNGQKDCFAFSKNGVMQETEGTNKVTRTYYVDGQDAFGFIIKVYNDMHWAGMGGNFSDTHMRYNDKNDTLIALTNGQPEELPYTRASN